MHLSYIYIYILATRHDVEFLLFFSICGKRSRPAYSVHSMVYFRAYFDNNITSIVHIANQLFNDNGKKKTGKVNLRSPRRRRCFDFGHSSHQSVYKKKKKKRYSRSSCEPCSYPTVGILYFMIICQRVGIRIYELISARFGQVLWVRA